MRCHIRKRGYRSWSIVIDLDRDANGKRRQKWITVKGTKRDAERKAAEISSSRRCTGFMGGGDSCSPAPMGNRCYRGRLATPSSRSPARRAFPTYGSTISDTRTPRLCYSRAVHLKVV